jgi:lipid II:glycine glycyltransferase (peptidoglycan interpeptide bridge formation enzyme)
MRTRDSTQPKYFHLEKELNTAVSSAYQVTLSYEFEDPAWDTFLAETPDGHHVQTSLWAQVKALIGWRAARLVVTRRKRIVAGVQLLIRSLPLAGAIGYAPKGPLFAVDDPVLPKLVINAIHHLARIERIQYLAIQPPSNGKIVAQQLAALGFRPSPLELTPTATVLIDLSQDLEDLLAQMRKKTRQYIRYGLRTEVTVREGSESDLGTFYRLVTATSQRQNFVPESEEYFTKMWRVLSPHGYIKLFLAECAGEAVSAQLIIPFGNTVIYKRVGWSGQYGNLRPNEVLHWTVIKWAKDQGFRYVDLEGIELEAATALMQNKPLPDALRQTPTHFKLGFGGQVTIFPGACDYVYSPFLRWAYTSIFPRIADWPVMAKVTNAVQGRNRG